MKRRIMSIDNAHCQWDWRVSTRWLHSLFWVYFQTTVSEQPSSVTYFILLGGRQMNAVNIGIQLAHVTTFPYQQIFFLFFLLSAHRTQYMLQASLSPTSSLLLPLFRTTLWWSFPILFCFVFVMLCFCCVFFLFLGSGEQSSTGVRGVQLWSCHVSHPPASVGGVT